MTAYELRNFIKNNFKSMYSDSLGSIQVALKKLFELEMVTFEELVEKGVNKKRYSITEAGQETLIEWIKIPINTSKTKNYDFGKLFFMGYVSKKDQKTLIDKIILSLEEEYEALKKLKESIDVEEESEEIENYLLADWRSRSRCRGLPRTRSTGRYARRPRYLTSTCSLRESLVRSREASVSASPWAAPSCATQRYSSWTSRSRTWTPSFASRCAPRSPSSTIAWVRRSSMSRTTRPRR